jgi:tetratricopeptide (TPR) repeat protein
VVVDQLDELFGAQIGEDVRVRFAKLLGLLAGSGRVWIIAALRADLFDRFLGQPVLKQLKEEGASYDLAPPDAAELAEIVRGPAAAADLVYETDSATGERLDERLLKDADRPDLLPLLQFTLNQLFEARETVDREARLTFAAYRALGGLEGAVDKEAEAALQALGEAERARLPRLLRELAAPAQDRAVRAGRTGYDIRSVPITDAAHDETSAKLVRALVDARILLSAGEGRQSTVRLAHGHVLDSWQRAKAIVAENADFYRIRAEVEGQRRRWEAARRSRDLLVGRGRQLAEAETLIRRFPEELPPATRDFIKRSGRRARLLQTLTAAAAVLFAVVAVVAVVARKQAEDQRQRAEQALATTTQIANTLVFDIGQDPRVKSGLPGDLLRQMFDRAIQGYDQAIRLNPNAAAYIGRGSAYGVKGDLDHAIADFDQAIRLDPKSAKAFLNRGSAYSAKGDLDHAIADFDQAIRLDPKSAKAFYARGLAFAAKEDYDRAIAYYNDAIGLDPKSAKAFYTRGLAFAAKEDYDRAIADYNDAIRLDPKDAGAYSNRGSAYSAKGDREHAIADYDQAIRLDPKNAMDFYNRGNAYDDKGDHEHAIADFDQAIRLNPKDAGAYSNRGSAYSAKGDREHAIADYDQAIRLDPKNADAYNGRCWARLIIGQQLQQALSDCNESLRIRPNSTDTLDSRGFAYLKLYRLDDAVVDFKAALEINSKLASSLYGRGLAKLMKGDRVGAHADMAAAKAIQADIEEKLARDSIK